VIAVQNVVLVRAHAIGHCLAAGEFTSGFDVNAHGFECNQRWIDDGAHSERIVHSRA
jgi:hypothetical protein